MDIRNAIKCPKFCEGSQVGWMNVILLHGKSG